MAIDLTVVLWTCAKFLSQTNLMGNTRDFHVMADTLDFLTWRQNTRDDPKLEYCKYKDGEEPKTDKFLELDDWSHFRQSSFRK